MNEDRRRQLMQIAALLQARHGLGFTGGELPYWLERRLSDAVQALLEARGSDVTALLEQLEHEPDLVIELANAVCVGETRFYRDAAQWAALRRHFLPGLWTRSSEQPPPLALSAGCSTGEEAWTLAMLLTETAPRSLGAARFSVLGIDRSAPALVTARSATYDTGSQQHLPSELAQRFLAPAVDGSVRVVTELQSQVTFECRDLTLGVPPGPHAVIICKNVLTHLHDEARTQLVRALLGALTTDGILLVARSEVPILQALDAPARVLAPGVTVFRAH